MWHRPDIERKKALERLASKMKKKILTIVLIILAAIVTYIMVFFSHNAFR